MKTQADLKKTPEDLANCHCGPCPSYTDCSRGKKELLFCAHEVGKSACEYKMSGCICGACPIHAEYELKSGYYCLKD